MAHDGRVAALALDPSVLRMDERMLAREVVTAVNMAWAACQGADEQAAAAVTAVDSADLHERLTELQDQSLASMRRYSEGLRDAVARIERSTAR
jgi:hypothetical protein